MDRLFLTFFKIIFWLFFPTFPVLCPVREKRGNIRLDENHEGVLGAGTSGAGRFLRRVIRTPEPFAVALDVGQRSPASDPSGHSVSAASASEVVASGRVFTPDTDHAT